MSTRTSTRPTPLLEARSPARPPLLRRLAWSRHTCQPTGAEQRAVVRLPHSVLLQMWPAPRHGRSPLRRPLSRFVTDMDWPPPSLYQKKHRARFSADTPWHEHEVRAPIVPALRYFEHRSTSRGFLELFSGSGGLPKAFAHIGMNTFSPIDSGMCIWVPLVVSGIELAIMLHIKHDRRTRSTRASPLRFSPHMLLGLRLDSDFIGVLGTPPPVVSGTSRLSSNFFAFPELVLFIFPIVLLGLVIGKTQLCSRT